MQQKSDIFQTFTTHTDFLALKLGSLEAVPIAMGISRAMFYAYRAGKNPISHKAWLKLERAEKAAGIEAEGRSELLRHSRQVLPTEESLIAARLEAIEAHIAQLTALLKK
ncbi:MAG: hypothetical protein LBD01_02575 [Puniceicoccales bacterium]|jgi:hypothetical protein|nr:hypothetical protein [Puniceicoccales bacterium]